MTLCFTLRLSIQAEHAEKDFFETLSTFMTSGPVVKLELERNNAIKAWRSLLGPTNPSVAKEQAPASIRAQFGNSEDPAVSTQVTVQPNSECILLLRHRYSVALKRPTLRAVLRNALPFTDRCLGWSRMLRTVATAQSLLRARLRSCSAPLRSRLRRKSR